MVWLLWLVDHFRVPFIKLGEDQTLKRFPMMLSFGGGFVDLCL